MGTNLGKYLLMILIPPLIILGNFRYLIFNFSYYQNLYQKVGVYETFGNSKIVKDATSNLFGYFRGKNELDQNFFSNQAVVHLSEVKKVLNFTLNFFYFLLAGVLPGLTLLIIRRQLRAFTDAILTASVITIVVVGLLAIGLLDAFNIFFLKFHQLLFKNNLWLFPEGDNLIKLFPQEFFIAFANQLATNILVTALTIALFVAFWRKQLK